MRYGLQLPIQSQSTIYVQPWEQGAGAAELVQVAQACEAAGFDYVAVCDHVAIPDDKADAMSTEWWDTIATLAYLAARTERVRLLSHVYVLPYRHPLVAAKAWATLDALSGGRAVLGVGAGHVEAEFDALGLPFAERGRLLDEAIDAVRDAFASEQRPRPVQARLPVWVGGSSPAAIRRAGQRGDGWLPQGPPEGGMEAGIARVHEHRAKAGRADEPFTIGALSGPLDLDKIERVVPYLQSFAAMGVDQVQVSFKSASVGDLCDQIARFAADVAPRVQEA